MEDTGRYGGTDPHSLSRALKYRGSPCPSCGSPLNLWSDVSDGEVVLKAPCRGCKKTYDIGVSVTEDRDVSLTWDGRPYEPSTEAGKAAAEMSDGRTGTDLLASEAALSAAYADTLRPAAARRLAEKVLGDSEGVEGAEDIVLRTATGLSAILRSVGEMDEAEDLEARFLPLAEGRMSADAFGFRLNIAMDMLADGDLKEASGTVNRTIADIDRLRGEGRLPEGDPSLRTRAYEEKGIVLAMKGDRSASVKAFKTAVSDARTRFETGRSPESMKDCIRATAEYAFACRDANLKKRSMGALKDCIRDAARIRDEHPSVYSEALLARARYLAESGEPLDGVRDDMDTCISLLGKPDADGDYDPMLPLAYMYRSMTGADKDDIDPDDLRKAFRILMDGTVSGNVPDTLLTTVGTAYLTYLESRKSPEAVLVREDMARMGIRSH